ncbi:hypothetical protein Tco_0732660, partial [Tanacetum coccineum]
VDVRTYLLGGAIDGSEANGIIRNPKLELESSRFTFDLVPLSYESVDVVVGKNWLLRHKAELVCHEKVVKMPWSCKVRVGSNGNLLWEASVLLGRKKGGVRVVREDDRGVTERKEDVREVFQQRGSGAKRKLSRCGRNQIGPFEILGWIGPYMKCLADANLHVPLDEIKIDKTLRFVEEPVEIMDREVKSLKRSKIPIVKVRWNPKRGPEFTWEREDHMKARYPRLFADCAIEPTS